MKKIAIAVFATCAAVTAQAQTTHLASLAAVDGKILVNKGKGFVSAKPGMPLSEGDRIVALDGSKAAVAFPDGCVAQVGENSILALVKGTGCDAKPVKTGAPVRVAQAIGGAANDGRPQGKPPTPPPPQGGTPPSPVFATGNIFILGGGLLMGSMIADQNRDNDNRPISRQ